MSCFEFQTYFDNLIISLLLLPIIFLLSFHPLIMKTGALTNLEENQTGWKVSLVAAWVLTICLCAGVLAVFGPTLAKGFSCTYESFVPSIFGENIYQTNYWNWLIISVIASLPLFFVFLYVHVKEDKSTSEMIKNSQ